MFLHPLEVPLNGSTSVWCISRSSQFHIIFIFAEGAFCPIIQVINEDAKQYLADPSINLWGAPLVTGLPSGFRGTDHNPVRLRVLSPTPWPLSSLYFISVSVQNAMSASVVSLSFISRSEFPVSSRLAFSLIFLLLWIYLWKLLLLSHPSPD